MRMLVAGLISASALLASTASASTATATVSKRLTALKAVMVLKVVHPTQARKEIAALAAQRGGFPTLVSDDELVLKLPPEVLNDTMRAISEKGLALEKSLVREDVTEEIAKLEGSLRSKSEILGRLRRFFADSNVAATLQIERSMTAVVSELEQVKGALRVERERARWAIIEVHFQFRQIGRTQYVHSPFEWLNSVDVDEFAGRFQSR